MVKEGLEMQVQEFGIYVAGDGKAFKALMPRKGIIICLLLDLIAQGNMEKEGPLSKCC